MRTACIATPSTPGSPSAPTPESSPPRPRRISPTPQHPSAGRYHNAIQAPLSSSERIALASTVLLCYLCSTVFRKPNPSSGVPIYVQLKEQIRHAIETGALSVGDQLPGIRTLAESLVINPNTILKVYRELEQEGVLEIRHGLGAFVIRRRRRSKTEEMRDAQQLVSEFVDNLKQIGLDEGEIRRLFEAELASEFQRR